MARWPKKEPAANLCFGTLFGSIVRLAAGEIAVPALNLSKPPQAYPLSKHVTALASHLVYGATTEFVRWELRRL